MLDCKVTPNSVLSSWQDSSSKAANHANCEVFRLLDGRVQKGLSCLLNESTCTDIHDCCNVKSVSVVSRRTLVHGAHNSFEKEQHEDRFDQQNVRAALVKTCVLTFLSNPAWQFRLGHLRCPREANSVTDLVHTRKPPETLNNS